MCVCRGVRLVERLSSFIQRTGKTTSATAPALPCDPGISGLLKHSSAAEKNVVVGASMTHIIIMHTQTCA